MAETTESIPHLEPQNPNELPHMSDNERDRITEVFKMYETDVRSAAMHPEVSNTSFFFCSFYLLHDFALKIRFMQSSTFYKCLGCDSNTIQRWGNEFDMIVKL